MGIIGSVCLITRIGSVRIPNALEEKNNHEDEEESGNIIVIFKYYINFAYF